MDTFALVADERRSLAGVLESLSADDWTQPSLCGAWSTHQVAAHLNVPFAVGSLTFVVEIAKALGRFDKANERVAVDLATRLSPAECIAGLRANADSRFTPPMFGPEAPLTDTIVHGGDILQPVGRTVAVAPEALSVSLPFITSAKARRGFGAVSADGLRIAPTDLDLTIGDGEELAGPAR
ncbi:MAG TPA: maleylpyruvate isomerase family mycothiol-dependent enzyme, partial [Acidimicrobiales bacterium]|nr:maleylpyruvate isomerase family mycothiol-dependent enzyme [Acidimicrobiales bacterium]